MYIKVCPHQTRNHYTFECNRYALEEINKEIVALPSLSDKTYAFPPIPGVPEGNEPIYPKYEYEMWLFDENAENLVAHILLMDCVVYIMSNEGKTIDTIWC